MDGAWDLLIARDDLSRVELTPSPLPRLSDGEVLLKVDRVGMTANNVTYGVTGESLDYWGFFPADDGWGRIPLWGFADVAASTVPEMDVGTRIYGYLPTSSHLVVRPGRVGRGGFNDLSAHRADLPAVYNRYSFTAHDPSFSGEQEDLQILYRPLFFTSFMLADFLGDSDFFGAERIVMSSASSKTAYGTAFCLGSRDRRPEQIALTSASNVGFTKSLGCYDEVVSYDDLETIPTSIATTYVDVAGNQSLRVRIHQHLGDHLLYDAAVGTAHMEETIGQAPDGPGPTPQFFFAPAQIEKRRADWGPGGVEQRYSEVWRDFVPKLKTWVEVKESAGPEGLRAAWLDVLSGPTDPKVGLVIGDL